jgi:hypothetical protein
LTHHKLEPTLIKQAVVLNIAGANHGFAEEIHIMSTKTVLAVAVLVLVVTLTSCSKGNGDSEPAPDVTTPGETTPTSALAQIQKKSESDIANTAKLWAAILKAQEEGKGWHQISDPRLAEMSSSMMGLLHNLRTELRLPHLESTAGFPGIGRIWLYGRRVSEGEGVLYRSDKLYF